MSLIHYKLRRQSVRDRELAIDHYVAAAPANLRGDFEVQLTAYGLLAVTPQFWKMDCGAFADSVAKVFDAKFKERGHQATDQQLFDAVELILLVLTRQVETDARVRKASGIGRGRPILWILLALIFGGLLWMFM